MQSEMKLSQQVQGLNGSLKVPGDKSISHRAVMFGSVANGETVIHNFLKGEDCLNTIHCFKEMGVEIEEKNGKIHVHGKGWDHLKEPMNILNVGNSGTTTRLMLGILAGLPFHSVIIGDDSIAKRPMKRVTEPLRKFGAIIDGREDGQFTPISIRGTAIEAIEYKLPVASAQVKSSLMLAALQAKGTTVLVEPAPTRNHTELMIEQFGGEVHSQNNTIQIPGGQQLKGTNVLVPGDISSAAFFLVAGAIVPNSKLELPLVGLNPTRTGIIDVLERMGATIHVQEQNDDQSEKTGTITIQSSSLKGIEISGNMIPTLIDELPVIALLATQADGTTVIKDAEELKVKETNRIDAIVNELRELGAEIEATDDGMIIHGKTNLHGGKVKSWHDHRIGMTMAIAALIADGDVYLKDHECVKISYPEFFADVNSLL
ncbi:3-phosphoshikimate 1-carboxyvinyltransferase [Bacillus pakistanensis]|uniref:3-phosphoshikimate 1-carboxyvinyltransferase n=1 Tax=Rossellomorea pakistanensis TaxID=992288 RepID=A0ABS2N907_9BACI|nr:3-phosphoshikimate 1-carboxyvinyltransferase [Bacillus pakistanensis]MBM7584342.1 3-phosphoshikimate 1-carboxyvinyltransferase [Bacillus pakistanensis]